MQVQSIGKYKLPVLWLQQDNVKCYQARKILTSFADKLPKRYISRRSEFDWHARSWDLSPVTSVYADILNRRSLPTSQIQMLKYKMKSDAPSIRLIKKLCFSLSIVFKCSSLLTFIVLLIWPMPPNSHR